MDQHSAEAHARQAVEIVLGRSLVEWDVDGRQGAFDFRGLDAPTLSLEVKLLTVKEFHAGQGRILRLPGFHPSSRLVSHWHVTIDLATSKHPAALLQVRGLIDQLEELLVEYEAQGREGSRTAPWPLKARFLELVGGGLALAHPATDKLPPGIQIGSNFGAVSRDDPNEVAAVVDAFINGDDKPAENLRQKLARSTDALRQAFIVLSPAIEEGHLLDDWGSERLPDQELPLPEMVDGVWMSAGGRTIWRFDDQGWAGFTLL